jgi:hypothetical protein
MIAIPGNVRVWLAAQYCACASARMETRGRRDLQISRKAGWREVQLIISVPRIHGCKHPQRELNKQNSVAFTLTCGSYGFVVNEDNGVICRRRDTRHYPGHDRFSSRPLLHSRAYLLNRIKFGDK